MAQLTKDTKIKLSQITDLPYWKAAQLYTYDERRKYKPGDRAVWKDGVYQKQPNGTWTKVAEKGEMNYATPRTKSDRRKYVRILQQAKSTQPPEKAWRVDTGHKQIDYKNDHLCMTKGGSVAAVTRDGDIISVCKNKTDPASGKKLLLEAVKAGGKKLDSYDGNFKFYTHCGFEPVSWCEFNEEYAPPGWDKNRDTKEPVVFFKYTGNVDSIEPEEFYKKVPAAADYDQAQAVRDKEIKNGKN